MLAAGLLVVALGIMSGAAGASAPDDAVAEPRVIGSPQTPEVAVRFADPAVAIELAGAVNAEVSPPWAASGRLSRWVTFTFPSVLAANAAIPALAQQPGVEVIEPLNPFLPAHRSTNDPLLGQQAHLNNTGGAGKTAGQDINVFDAWDDEGVTGAGITIGIVDDGLQTDHPDLNDNYSAALSYDFLDDDTDVSPAGNDFHGTAVAGTAAAEGDNNVGVASPAYASAIAALRLIVTGQTITFGQVRDTLRHEPNLIHVYNNSWGSPDTGDYSTPSASFEDTIQDGVERGRNGRGSIFVWSAGNGGDYSTPTRSDRADYDQFTSHPGTITVGALDLNGDVTDYTEPGSCVLISTPHTSGSLTTTRTSLGNPAGYTSNIQGTSFTAPQVSGIVALMLEANPNLTWRDVQHILIRTADTTGVGDTTFDTNGAGFSHSYAAGFGRADAATAVATAKGWVSAPAQVSRDAGRVVVGSVPSEGITPGVTSTVTVDAQDGIFVEHARLTIEINHDRWADLAITLTSPAGTESVLAREHDLDGGNGDAPGGDTFTFTSLRHWGESSTGTWTVEVSDEKINGTTGAVVDWRLVLLGTTTPTGASVTVEENNPGPDTLNGLAAGAERIVSAAFTLTPADDPVVTGLRISPITYLPDDGDDAFVTGVEVWRDVNGDQALDNGDVRLGGAPLISNTADVDITFGTPQTLTAETDYLVTHTFAPDAPEGSYGIGIGTLFTAGGTLVDGLPIQGRELVVNQPSVMLSRATTRDVRIAPGSFDAVYEIIRATGIIDSTTLDGIVLELDGASESDVTNLRIFLDDGDLELGLADTLLGTAVRVNDTFTVTLNPARALNVGQAQYLLVVVDTPDEPTGNVRLTVTTGTPIAGQAVTNLPLLLRRVAVTRGESGGGCGVSPTGGSPADELALLVLVVMMGVAVASARRRRRRIAIPTDR
jgi:subtilisin family serine protease